MLRVLALLTPSQTTSDLHEHIILVHLRSYDIHVRGRKLNFPTNSLSLSRDGTISVLRSEPITTHSESTSKAGSIIQISVNTETHESSKNILARLYRSPLWKGCG